MAFRISFELGATASLALIAMATACADGDEHASGAGPKGTTGSAQVAGMGARYARIDISKLAPFEREQLKEQRGVERWVEVDRQLLLLASPAALDEVSAKYDVTTLDVAPRPDKLCLTHRGRHHAEQLEGAVLAWSSSHVVLQVDSPEACATSDASGQSATHLLKDSEIVARQLTPQVSVAANPLPHTRDVVGALDMNNWMANVTTLAAFDRYALRPTNIGKATEWIAGQFCGIAGAPLAPEPSGGGLRCERGSTSVRTEAFSVGGVSARNVVLTVGGFVSNGPVYVVGGHYDAIATEAGATRAPGAEDNASGTAAVIEMARALARFPSDATVIFVAFSGEEAGLFGSKHYVQQLAGTALAQRLRGVFIMDMIGYSGDTELDCLLETKDTPDNQLLLTHMANMAGTFAPELVLTTSTNPFGSDHVPFLNAGYSGLLAIENDYESYPFYHSRNDTVANQNSRFQTMAGLIVRMNTAAVAEWSSPNAFYAALLATQG